MINQRGQAFSVFQLLIAAIVAIAILGVLFSVMQSVNPSFSGNATTEIKNALSTVKTGGQVDTQTFKLSKGDNISATAFEEVVPIDSIIFYIKTTGGLKVDSTNGFEIKTETAGDEEFDELSFSGANSVTVKATVVCASTGARLDAAINDIDDLDADSSDEICLNDEDITPCCAVIIKRA